MNNEDVRRHSDDDFKEKRKRVWGKRRGTLTPRLKSNEKATEY